MLFRHSATLNSQLRCNEIKFEQKASRERILCNTVCQLKREIKLSVNLEPKQFIRDRRRSLVTSSAVRWMESYPCSLQHNYRQTTFSEQKIIFLILHYFLTRKSHSRCQLIPWTSPWAGSSSSLPHYEGRGGRQVQAQVCSWHIVDKDRDLCAWTHTLGTQTFCSRGFSEYFICKTACAEFCRSQKSFPGRGTTDSRD